MEDKKHENMENNENPLDGVGYGIYCFVMR